jgi:hypothetical protein
MLGFIKVNGSGLHGPSAGPPELHAGLRGATLGHAGEKQTIKNKNKLTK